MDITLFCKFFYDAHYIPIVYYKQSKPVFWAGLLDIINLDILSIADYEKFYRTEVIFFEPYQAFYGVIPLKTKGEFLFIGPAGYVYNKNIVQNFQKYAVSNTPKEEIEKFFLQIPKITYNQFLHLIQFLSFIITGKQPITMLPHVTPFNNLSTSIAKKHIESSYESQIELNFHGTYHYERLMIEHVRDGNVQAIKDLLTNFSFQNDMNPGILSTDSVRQAKNIFNGVIVLVGKDGAISGGMDIEETYQLIDTYVQECENLQSADKILALQYSMLIDFTERVAQTKLPNNLSKDVLKCVQYINQHYTEPITITSLSEHVSLSRSHLSNLFKKEMGQTIIEYITHQRIAQAKTLLRYSNRSISEISEFLCFNSQAYFQNVFKKTTGTTPLNYRKTVTTTSS